MWQDNYAYLLQCSRSGAAALVDPAEGRAVRNFLEQQRTFDRRTIRTILTTHGHGDHAPDPSLLRWLNEGEDAKGDEAAKLRVFSRDRVAGLTHPIEEGRNDTDIEIGDLRVRAMPTPCHTPGSVCYLVQDEEQPAVFTGDVRCACLPSRMLIHVGRLCATYRCNLENIYPPRFAASPKHTHTQTLFSFGCGRFNNGTAQQMYSALSRLAQLPGNTLVYSGHEYTVDNLKFARSIEPENQDMVAELEAALAKVCYCRLFYGLMDSSHAHMSGCLSMAAPGWPAHGANHHATGAQGEPLHALVFQGNPGAAE